MMNIESICMLFLSSDMECICQSCNDISQGSFSKLIYDSFDRILDNLPLVVPIRRSDQDSPTVYQLGYHIGLKGQYSGVT